MSFDFRRVTTLVAGLAMLSVGGAAGAAQRTFVSTVGSDGSATCALLAPCRAFAKAVTVTDPGGEIVVLDSGGYGSVIIDKSVSIVSPLGIYAGISVFGGDDGVTITSPAGKVVLRGLTINGQGGSNGIRVQAGEVNIESTVISNMGAAAVLVESGTTVRLSAVIVRDNFDGLVVQPQGATTVAVVVRDSEFAGNSKTGITVLPIVAGSGANVTVERSSLVKNVNYGAYLDTGGVGAGTLVITQSVASENPGAGIFASGANATLWVRDSAVTRNGSGLVQSTTAVLNACGANLLAANGAATVGIINTASCLDVASGSGTVTSVGTGSGLIGGPITTSGTINLATTQLLPTLACGTNQVPQWNGSAWACATVGGGPAPANSVVSETAFGQASAVGVAVNYAREDHTHGTPVLPALGGDVSGAITSNSVVGLQGVGVSPAAPAAGQVLTYNGANWAPSTPPAAQAAPVIVSWAGQGAVLEVSMPDFIFSGPTVVVTVPANGRLTGSASIPMATSASTTPVNLGLCYRQGAGALNLFAGSLNYQTTTVTSTLAMYSTHGSIGGLPAGNYDVGLCAQNTGSTREVSVQERVNGWVMVTAS